MCNRDIHKPFMIKEKKRKSRKDSKKEKQGIHRWWEKIKRKKEMGSGEWGVGFTCMVGKKEEWKRKKKKNLKGKKLNWFHLYVHFVWCKV